MRTPTLLPALAVTLAVAAMAVGCSSSTAGTAHPTSTDSPELTEPTATDPSAPDTNDVQAPPVEHPLDATDFLDNPCEILTTDQLTGFQITTPGRPRITGAIAEHVGPACDWSTDSVPVSVLSVGLTIGNENGLTDIYRLHTDGQYPDFEPLEIDGYPAVIANALAHDRASGVCEMNVGISDAVAFSVVEQGGLGPDEVCVRTEQVAAAVLATLKASQ